MPPLRNGGRKERILQFLKSGAVFCTPVTTAPGRPRDKNGHPEAAAHLPALEPQESGPRARPDARVTCSPTHPTVTY